MRAGLRRELFAAALPLLVAVANPAAATTIIDTTLTTGGAYTVFGLGSTMSIGSADTISANTATINGNVAVGADTGSANADGNGTFQKGYITGSLWVDPQASYQIVCKNFVVGGTVFGTGGNCTSTTDVTGAGTSTLDGAVSNAVAASASFAALPLQDSTKDFTQNGATASLTIGPGVYSTTDFDFNSGATLNIVGTGDSNESVIVNITGGFDFTKSFITRTNIAPEQILFNVLNAGTTAEVSGDESIFFGTLLAVYRDITIAGLGTGSGTGVGPGDPGFQGRVIGSLGGAPVPGGGTTGNLELIVHSGAQVVPEPGTLLLLLPAVGMLVARSHGGRGHGARRA